MCQLWALHVFIKGQFFFTFIEPHEVVHSSVARIKVSFWLYFPKLVYFMLSLFCVFLYHSLCFLSCILLLMLHSCVLN